MQALSGTGATLLMLLGLWITTREVRRHSRIMIAATSCAIAGCYVLVLFLIRSYAASPLQMKSIFYENLDPR
jgi:uncharacterized membrane protein YozB (DUF420 family)